MKYELGQLKHTGAGAAILSSALSAGVVDTKEFALLHAVWIATDWLGRSEVWLTGPLLGQKSGMSERDVYRVVTPLVPRGILVKRQEHDPALVRSLAPNARASKGLPYYSVGWRKLEDLIFATQIQAIPDVDLACAGGTQLDTTIEQHSVLAKMPALFSTYDPHREGDLDNTFCGRHEPPCEVELEDGEGSLGDLGGVNGRREDERGREVECESGEDSLGNFPIENHEQASDLELAVDDDDNDIICPGLDGGFDSGRQANFPTNNTKSNPSLMATAPIPYSIGIAANLNLSRPAQPNSIPQAGVITFRAGSTPAKTRSLLTEAPYSADVSTLANYCCYRGLELSLDGAKATWRNLRQLRAV